MRVPTVFTAIDRFSHVVDRMSKSASAFGATAQAAAMRTSRKMDSIGNSALRTSAIIGASLIKPINDAVLFEDQMDKINTILHETPSGLSRISKEVRDLAKISVNGLDNITESYLDLASAGVDQKNIMPLLKAAEKLSVGGVGTMQDAVELLLAKQGAFASEGLTPQQSINQAQKIMKHGKGTLAELSPTYSEGAVPFGLAGGSSSQYDAMIAGLTAVNQTQATAISQIGLMTRSAQKGVGNFKKIFKELNISSFSKLVARNSGNVVESFSQIVDKGESMGFNIDQIWGRAGASVGVSLLLKNQKAINQYTTAYADILNDANNEADKAYGERANNRRSQLARLTNQLKDLSITIGDYLLPAVSEFSSQAKPMFERMTKFLKDNPNTIKNVLKLSVALLVIGVVAKTLASVFFIYSTAIGVVSAVTKAYTFISTLAALANVSFATALWGVVTALWAALWPVLAVVAALAIMVVWIYDVVNHWSDWKEILLVMVGPIGWITYGLLKILEHSRKIRNAFAFEGWFGGLKAIGRMLVDMILTPLEKIFNVMSRLPMVGDHFKFMSASIADARSGFSETKAVGNLSGSSQFQNLGGAMPTWGAAENLAGKNQNQASMEKGGTLRVVIDDKTNKVKDVDDTNVYGIPVVLSGNQGNWGR